MIATLTSMISFLKNKAVQYAALIGFTLLVLLKARADIRADAQKDIIRDMEKADEKRASDIRSRVADAHRRVRAPGEDTRGFRD